MQEKICCIYDKDERYALKLTEAMNDMRDVPYKVMAFTSENALIECGSNYCIEVLLVGEDTDGEVIQNVKAKHVYFLSDDKNDLENFILCKFQPTEKLVKLLLAGLNDEGVEHVSGRLRVSCIYSPVSACFKTTVALGYAYYTGKRRKVLYINLELFSGLQDFFGECGTEKGLSDAIFYYMTGSENQSGKIIQCINNKYGFDYFNPVVNCEDIGEITPEILWNFIKVISEVSIYDEIVIELGNVVNNPCSFLMGCDQIILPEAINENGKMKEKEFFSFLEKSRFKGLLDKLKRIAPAVNSELVNKKLSIEVISNCVIEDGLRKIINE